MAKSWKALERKILACYGMIRTGPLGKNKADGLNGFLAIEVKGRKNKMQTIENMLKQAERNDEGLIPVVIYHWDHCRMGEEHVVMRMKDHVELCRRAGYIE